MHKILFIILFLLYTVFNIFAAAPTIGSVGGIAANGIPATTLSWTHTTGASDTLLVVFVANYSATANYAQSSVAWRGQSLTKQNAMTQTNGNMNFEVWAVTSPVQGVAGNVTVTVATACAVSARSFGIAGTVTGSIPMTQIGQYINTAATTYFESCISPYDIYPAGSSMGLFGYAIPVAVVTYTVPPAVATLQMTPAISDVAGNTLSMGVSEIAFPNNGSWCDMVSYASNSNIFVQEWAVAGPTQVPTPNNTNVSIAATAVATLNAFGTVIATEITPIAALNTGATAFATANTLLVAIATQTPDSISARQTAVSTALTAVLTPVQTTMPTAVLSSTAITGIGTVLANLSATVSAIPTAVPTATPQFSATIVSGVCTIVASLTIAPTPAVPAVPTAFYTAVQTAQALAALAASYTPVSQPTSVLSATMITGLGTVVASYTVIANPTPAYTCTAVMSATMITGLGTVVASYTVIINPTPAYTATSVMSATQITGLGTVVASFTVITNPTPAYTCTAVMSATMITGLGTVVASLTIAPTPVVPAVPTAFYTAVQTAQALAALAASYTPVPQPTSVLSATQITGLGTIVANLSATVSAIQSPTAIATPTSIITWIASCVAPQQTTIQSIITITPAGIATINAQSTVDVGSATNNASEQIATAIQSLTFAPTPVVPAIPTTELTFVATYVSTVIAPQQTNINIIQGWTVVPTTTTELTKVATLIATALTSIPTPANTPIVPSTSTPVLTFVATNIVPFQTANAMLSYTPTSLPATNTYTYTYTPTNTATPPVWKVLGTAGSNNVGSVVFSLHDNNLLIGGYTDQTSSDDFYMSKVDLNGNTIWVKTFGGLGDEEIIDATEDTINGTYAFVGSTTSFGNGGVDVLLYITDTDGNCLSVHTFGGPGDEYGNSIISDEQGTGFYINGQTTSFGAGGNDIYFIKTDALGNCITTRTYGFADEDIGEDVELDPDNGNIFLGGYTNSIGAGGYDQYVITVDSGYNCINSHTYGTVADEYLNTTYFSKTDHTFTLSGWQNNGAGTTVAYINHIAQDLSIDWTQSYGDPGWVTKAYWEVPFGGNLYFGGSTNSQSTQGTGATAGGYDGGFVETDNYGNFLSVALFGGILDDEFLSIAHLGSKIALLGYTKSYGVGGGTPDGYSHIYLVIIPDSYLPTPTDTPWYTNTFTPTPTDTWTPTPNQTLAALVTLQETPAALASAVVTLSTPIATFSPVLTYVATCIEPIQTNVDVIQAWTVIPTSTTELTKVATLIATALTSVPTSVNTPVVPATSTPAVPYIQTAVSTALTSVPTPVNTLAMPTTELTKVATLISTALTSIPAPVQTSTVIVTPTPVITYIATCIAPIQTAIVTLSTPGTPNTPTNTGTFTNTPTITNTYTNTPTFTKTPIITNTFTKTFTFTPTPNLTATYHATQTQQAETATQAATNAYLTATYYATQTQIAKTATEQATETQIAQTATAILTPVCNQILWSKVNSNALWSIRWGNSSLVYNSLLWVIGGHNNNTINYCLNDVWSSSDGINWIANTQNAQFSPRYSHVSIIYNNKMWVIGGYNGNSYLNDVWSSSDGITWNASTLNAQFTPRYGMSSIAYNSKMWIIGGASGYKNDVWSSSDGITWTLAGYGAFSPRQGHTSVVFNSKMWVIGGYGSNGWTNDAWYSTNGIDWTPATQNAQFAASSSLLSGTYGNYIYVYDGLNQILWQSSDGVIWAQTTAYSGFLLPTVVQNISGAYQNTLLWFFGGNNGTIKYNNVWQGNINYCP